MIAMPDPSTFAVLPWRPEEQGVGRMFCDVVTPERTPYEGDPRHVLRRALRARAGDGLRHLQRRARARVLPVPRLALNRGARQRRLLRPDDARRGLRRAPRDGARARAARDPRRVHPPRGRALPARDRHALRRRAEDGRRLHDLPHHRQGVRDEVRLARDASCRSRCSARTAPGMHTHQSLFNGGRTPSTTPTTSTSSRTSARPSSPASSSTRARSARSSPSGSTPTSASCPASRRPSTSPGRGATARRSCACRCTTRAREQATRMELRCPDPACNPYLTFAVLLQAGLEGIEKGYELPEPMEKNLYHLSGRGAPAPGRRAAAGEPRRGDRDHRRVRARAAHARRAHLQPLRRDQAPGVGGLPRPGHAVGARPLPVDPVGSAAAGGDRAGDRAGRGKAPVDAPAARCPKALG